MKSEKSYAFPNPTNSSEEVLTVYFCLKEPSDILLKIYDQQGRLLEQASKEKMPAGGHEIKLPVSNLKQSRIFKLNCINNYYKSQRGKFLCI